MSDQEWDEARGSSYAYRRGPDMPDADFASLLRKHMKDITQITHISGYLEVLKENDQLIGDFLSLQLGPHKRFKGCDILQISKLSIVELRIVTPIIISILEQRLAVLISTLRSAGLIVDHYADISRGELMEQGLRNISDD